MNPVKARKKPSPVSGWKKSACKYVSVRRLLRVVSSTVEKKFSLTAYNVLLPGDGAVPELLEHDDYRWVRPEDLDAFDFVESDRIVVRALTD